MLYQRAGVYFHVYIPEFPGGLSDLAVFMMYFSVPNKQSTSQRVG